MLGKFASLLGTVVAALAAAGASQLLAFVHAYRQRLGGHVDEAQRTVHRLQNGEIAGVPVDPLAREQLLASFEHRLGELRIAHDAIERSGVFAKPVAFLRHMDREIAAATLDNFTPAVPLDVPSLVFALAGLALAWVVWGVAGHGLSRLVRRRRMRAA